MCNELFERIRGFDIVFVADESKVRLTNGCAWNAESAFANCGRAVAHGRGSYGPTPEVRRSYSITASARATRPAGISRPRLFAVFRLITNSKRDRRIWEMLLFLVHFRFGSMRQVAYYHLSFPA